MSFKDLQPHFERKQYVGILRDFSEEEDYIFGVPVALSEDFVIVQEISEFYLYGYAIVPIDTIVEVRRDVSDAFIDHILREEGIMDKIGLKHEVNLKSWESIFLSLKETSLTVTVQCEEMEDDFFFIGPVKRVDEDAVWIHYFDSEGVLSEAWDEIPFDEITRVGFDEPYSNIFSKYLRSLN